jgi:hypothetical protein
MRRKAYLFGPFARYEHFLHECSRRALRLPQPRHFSTLHGKREYPKAHCRPPIPDKRAYVNMDVHQKASLLHCIGGEQGERVVRRAVVAAVSLISFSIYATNASTLDGIARAGHAPCIRPLGIKYKRRRYSTPDGKAEVDARNLPRLMHTFVPAHHHAISPSTSTNRPETASSPSNANWTGVFAACLAVMKPLFPVKSVLAYPGLIEFTTCGVSRNSSLS